MTQARNLHNKQLLEELASLRAFHYNVRNSKSWKLTSPLRHLTRALGQLIAPHQRKSKLLETIFPSSKATSFDPQFYKRAYPDSADDPYSHYLTYGLPAGKPGKSPELTSNENVSALDTAKKNALLVVHDSDRSGTPILTYNIAKLLRKEFNIILLPLHGGELLSTFHQIADITLSPFPDAYDENVASAVLGSLLEKGIIDFAIVNSIVSRSVLRILAEHYIPSVCLIHEFPAYVRPKDAVLQVQLWATRTIYSSEFVYENTVEQCPELSGIEPIILPQGKCSPPNDVSAKHGQREKELIAMLRPAHLTEDSLLIVGVGTVEFRKGVDLFIDCAARLIKDHPELPLFFAWVGPGYDPDGDLSYSTYLKDQVKRSGLNHRLIFTGDVQLIETVYHQADLLFLSSRLDPLPNVAIEALSTGVPVVCFKDTTGIANLLTRFGLAQECVVPYLRTDLAANSIATLCNDPTRIAEIGNESKILASNIFDMEKYSRQLSQTALHCMNELKSEQVECSKLIDYDLIDLPFFCPPTMPPLNKQQAARLFIRSWRSGVQRRKPFAGFHPGIYAERNGIDLSVSNPFIDFLEQGKPEGPWLSRIITPSQQLFPQKTKDYRQHKTGLHIHCYYPELLQTLMDQICQQPITQLDLLISTVSDHGLKLAKELTHGWKIGEVDIRKVPNIGRDIGPFLTEFGDDITSNYEIIGHIHTKRSQDVGDDGLVQIWFNYLIEHLIGARHQIVSTILDEFALDGKLGLVFPEDPYVTGWSANDPVATQLAKSLGLTGLLSNFFNFPVGNMFWARIEALTSLFQQDFCWENYPKEPLHHDGTSLHALERLTPFISQMHGFHYAMTHIPGMTR